MYVQIVPLWYAWYLAAVCSEYCFSSTCTELSQHYAKRIHQCDGSFHYVSMENTPCPISKFRFLLFLLVLVYLLPVACYIVSPHYLDWRFGNVATVWNVKMWENVRNPPHNSVLMKFNRFLLSFSVYAYSTNCQFLFHWTSTEGVPLFKTYQGIPFNQIKNRPTSAQQ